MLPEFTMADSEMFYAANMARKLADFCKDAWNIIEPGTKLVWGWHHDALCEHLQAVDAGQIQNLAISFPPRHGKSSICSVLYEAWVWTHKPWYQFLCASFGYDLAMRDSEKCRMLVESKWYHDKWGESVFIRPDANRKERYITTEGGHRICGSVNGIGTGDGGHCVVVDDGLKISDRFSSAARREVIDWWTGTMYDRVAPPATGKRIVIGHRLAEDDLIGCIIKGGNFANLYLMEEYDPKRRCVVNWKNWHWDKDPRKQYGELLCPEWLSAEKVEEYKNTKTASEWAALYQQWPVPDGGGRFKRTWFRYFKILNGSYVLYKPDGSTKDFAIDDCDHFGVLDPAGVEKDQNNKPCYSVLQVWAVTSDGEMLLIDQYREQAETPDTVDAIVKMTRKHDLPWVAVEKNGLGIGVVQTAKRRGVAVRSIWARGSKEARSEAAEIRMQNGGVYFLSGAPWVNELERELELFPAGEFKDQADTLSHAAILVLKRKGAIRTEEDEQAQQNRLAEIQAEARDDELIAVAREEGRMQGPASFASYFGDDDE